MHYSISLNGKIGWLIGGILLVAIIWFTYTHAVEEKQFLLLVGQVKIEWTLLSIVAQILTYVFSGATWRQILKSHGLSLSFLESIKLSLEKLVVDHVMPAGGVSGTAMLVGYCKTKKMDNSSMGVVLILAYMSYVYSYLIAVVIAMMILYVQFQANKAIQTTSLIGLSIATLISLLSIFLLRLRPWKYLPRLSKIRFIGKFQAILTSVPDKIFADKSLLMKGTALQFGIFLADAATLGFFFLALGYPVSPVAVYCAVVLASVAATIGVVPAGIGTFEAGALGTLALFQIPTGVALLAILLFRGFTLWIPVLAGIIFFRSDAKRLLT